MDGLCIFFFFQAEDGIRDVAVTGVQTCALPISAVGAQDRARPQVHEVRGPAAAGIVAALDGAEQVGVGRRGLEDDGGSVLLVVRQQHVDPIYAEGVALDRKSTRLNSSHGYISYAVF